MEKLSVTSVGFESGHKEMSNGEFINVFPHFKNKNKRFTAITKEGGKATYQSNVHRMHLLEKFMLSHENMLRLIAWCTPGVV